MDIAGQPEVRSALLSASKDGESVVVVWECSAGTFRWNYGFDETIYFLEGSVTFEYANGGRRTAGPGDVVHFPKGASVIWQVHTRVKKLAVCRKVLPGPLAAFIASLRRLKALLKGRGDEGGLSAGPAANG